MPDAFGAVVIYSAADGEIGDRLCKVVRLVLGVARLGEADLLGWWGCRGLNRTGRFVLGGMFPRTSAQVGLELDVLSAQRRHEKALAGRGSALHLFSDGLPFRRWASSWLSAQKTSTTADGVFEEMATWDNEAGVDWLSGLAGEPVPGEVVADGLRLGALSSVDFDSRVKLDLIACSLASAYPGLGSDFKAPYFDLRD